MRRVRGAAIRFGVFEQMRWFFSICCVLGSLAAASTVSAQTWYAGGHLGLNYGHDATSGSGDLVTYEFFGMGFGAVIGRELDNNLRAEGEITYRSNEVDTVGVAASSATVTSLAVMANGFYDFKQAGSGFIPYVGGGVGVASADYTAGGQRYSDTVVAMQLGAGVTFNLSPDLAASVDYRLFGTEDLGLGAGSGLGKLEYINSSVFLGLRKSF